MIRRSIALDDGAPSRFIVRKTCHNRKPSLNYAAIEPQVVMLAGACERGFRYGADGSTDPSLPPVIRLHEWNGAVCAIRAAVFECSDLNPVGTGGDVRGPRNS